MNLSNTHTHTHTHFSDHIDNSLIKSCHSLSLCALLPLRQWCVLSQADSAAYRVGNHLLEGNSLVETLHWSGQIH